MSRLYMKTKQSSAWHTECTMDVPPLVLAERLEENHQPLGSSMPSKETVSRDQEPCMRIWVQTQAHTHTHTKGRSHWQNLMLLSEQFALPSLDSCSGLRVPQKLVAAIFCPSL
jgi:hypothetical protein